MSDKYLAQLLSDNEKIIMVTRRHWLFLLGQITPELALILLILVAVTTAWATLPIAAFSALGYLLIILPLISLGRDFLIWHNNKHVVTTRRVIHMSGVWSKNVTDSSLEKVNDVKMEQSAMGRVFDFGDIEILTASELGINRFSRIANPIRLKTAMLNAKATLDSDGGGRRSQPGDNIPTLIARLGKLHEQGVLTDAEFNEKKAELLAKI
jgi:uncharacterized membrane protein YdbT with pleckstrin-like domain